MSFIGRFHPINVYLTPYIVKDCLYELLYKVQLQTRLLSSQVLFWAAGALRQLAPDLCMRGTLGLVSLARETTFGCMSQPVSVYYNRLDYNIRGQNSATPHLAIAQWLEMRSAPLVYAIDLERSCDHLGMYLSHAPSMA